MSGRALRGRLLLASGAAALLLGAGWVMASPTEPALAIPEIERIVVYKGERRMELYSGGQLVHTIAGLQLGDAPVGHTQFQGDEKTPEGRYAIDCGNPESVYHLSLHIDYPHPADLAYAAARKRSAGAGRGGAGQLSRA